jgi:hypothetical protein
LQRLLSSTSIRAKTRAVAARLTPVPPLDSVLDAISEMASKTGRNGLD